MTDSITRVACIGAGLIGTGWAAHFLRASLDVVAYDTDPARERYVRQTITAVWPALEQLGLSEGASPHRLTFTADLDAALDGVRNPDEFVNNDVKQARARRTAPTSKADLKSSLRSYMHSLQRRPTKVRTFFQAPTARYAA